MTTPTKPFEAGYEKGVLIPGAESLMHDRLLLDFSEIVADAMTARSMSRAELARRVGVSRAYVTQTLRGDTSPTLRTIAKFCTALDISPALADRER